MNKYKGQVELLLRIIPLFADEECFAIHGGTAINLFIQDLPRYSVDIDLTYIPLRNREESITHIDERLLKVKEKIERSLRGVQVSHRADICKLLCNYKGHQVKVEVNQTKRGIVCGEVQTLPLCDKAQEEFGMYCEANIVPTELLYGGKVAAALSRQHPRDLFDVCHMDISLSSVRYGLLFFLLGSDRPIFESLSPHLIDQRKVMETQFNGMTNTPFSYADYEKTRQKLVEEVATLYSPDEKAFLLSFEAGSPMWELLPKDYQAFKEYPSIQWKLLNIRKLRDENPALLAELLEHLKSSLSIIE